jgi:hypothetical protein
MSIRQVGILIYFRFWQAYRMPQGGEAWLIVVPSVKPSLILIAGGPLRSRGPVKRRR